MFVEMALEGDHFQSCLKFLKYDWYDGFKINQALKDHSLTLE